MPHNLCSGVLQRIERAEIVESGSGRCGTVPILDAQYKCWLGEAWDIMVDEAGRSLAAFGHAAGSGADITQPRNEVTRFRHRAAR